jgi:prepilin-type N-terminal cleavage/methylation domain-containing protein
MTLKQKAFSLIELSIVVLIIGILVAGATQGSRMVKQSRIKTAQNLTSGSGINAISGLTLWLEATLPGAIISTTHSSDPEDGDLVSSWKDVGSVAINQISVTQSVAGKYPTYVDSGINQLPSLKFSGAQYLFSTPAAGGLPITPGNDDFTLIAVWMPLSAITAVVYEQNNSSLVNGKRASFQLVSSSNYGFSGESNDFYITPYVLKKAYISAVTFSSTGAVSVYSNSSAASNTTTLNATTQNVGSSYFAVGVKSSTGFTQEFFNGYISEIMIFDRSLRQPEINEIQTYLAAKYKITVS